MATRSGTVPGATLRLQAEFLAGALAEHSRTDLRWRAPDGAQRPLLPRQTDLPGLLVREHGTLLCPSLDLTVERTQDRLLWTSSDPQCARLLGAPP